MEYRLTIYDSQCNWVVTANTPEGKIGHLYTFKPFNAIIIKDAYDQEDIHYFRKPKTPIPVGTEVIINNWWQNLEGCYFKINYNGSDYDVKPSCVKIESNN